MNLRIEKSEIPVDINEQWKGYALLIQRIVQRVRQEEIEKEQEKSIDEMDALMVEIKGKDLSD